MLIFGNGEFAQVMQRMFHCQLTVERPYIKSDEIPFDEAKPQHLLIAMGPSSQNRNRKKIYILAKGLGFDVMTYAHPDAIIDTRLGEGCIVFERNNIQPFTTVGNNTVLWSGNHVGHHSRIGNHCFITSHCVISGGVEIGDRCFLGVNCTILDHLKIGEGSIIQAGAVVDKDVLPDSVWTREGLSKVPAHKVRL